MQNAFWNLRRKKTTFEQFLESVRKWYAGIPYDVTDKNQNEQFASDPRPVFAVGLNVSNDRRTIDNCVMVQVKV